MGHAFEQHNEVELRATPEEVWQAIATGPGIDSWYMGRTDVRPGPDGSVRTLFSGYTLGSEVTAWEPERHLAYRSAESGDGRFIAFEYLIEGRGQGSTVLRMTASGFLPGDDWADEYDALTKGGAMYFHTLTEYLTYFPGRTATPITAFGPPVTDWAATWAALTTALGLGAPVREGAEVRAKPAGLPPIDGVVDFVNADCLGIRTDDALYRFVQGRVHGFVVVGHHLFTPGVDRDGTERAWQAWLATIGDSE